MHDDEVAMNKPEQVVKQLARERAARGIPRWKVAEALGKSLATVYRYEKGLSLPTELECQGVQSVIDRMRSGALA
jgi:transcriptional regulator with XRE-family HTH domain